MRTAIRLLIPIALCLLLAGIANGAGINDISTSTVAPEYMENFTQIILRYGIMILFGVMIAWSVWHAKDNDLKPAFITFTGMLVVCIGLMVFFGAGQMGSWDAATSHGFIGYDWHTYGELTGMKNNFPSQAHGYEMQKGWALAGACYWYRLIDIGFSFYLIPLIGIGGCFLALIHSYRMKSPRPLFVHLAALLVVVPLYLLPTVQFNSPVTDNPMYKLLIAPVDADTSTHDGDAEHEILDSPRVSPFMAVSFGVLTDLAERIGEKISIGTRKPNSIILHASLDARLNKGDYSLYMKYASFCFTAVHSVTDLRLAQSTNQEFNDYYKRLLGDLSDTKPGGAMGNFKEAPLVFKHALSPFSDAIFQDLWLHRWVYQDFPDLFGFGDNYDFYEGTYAINEIAEPYSYHPNPTIGAGNIERVGKGLKISKSAVKLVGSEYAPGPALQDPAGIYGGWFAKNMEQSGKVFIPFCSIAGLKDSGVVTSTSSPDLLPPIFMKEFPEKDDVDNLLPFSYGDYVRMVIASRYIGIGSNDYCAGVSPDRSNSDLWGCLVAGKYRKDDTEQAKSMKVVQDEFDSWLRPKFSDSINQQYILASTHGGIPAERNTAQTYWQSGTFEMTGYNFTMIRDFCDMYFTAPGVHSQIGLFGDMKNVEQVKGNTDNWFYSIVIGIGGYLKPGIAGLMSWIATGISKIAMMMWPHVLGVMTFIVFLKSVPYLVRGIWCGQWLFPIFHLLPGIAMICIMPIFVQIGLSFTEMGNGMALPALMIRSEAGADFGEAVLQIIGSFFIVSAFSLSATFMTLGFGSLAGLLGTVNATAFKLTGAGVAGSMAIAGIAATVVTGGKAALLASAAMGLGKKAGGATEDAGTSGKPPSSGDKGGTNIAGGGGSGAVANLAGTSGKVRTEESKPAVEMASPHHVEDMRGQLSSIHGSRASGGGGGGGLGQVAGELIIGAGAGAGRLTRNMMSLGAETTGAIASSLSHGNEGASIAQGISAGFHLASKAGDALFPPSMMSSIMSPSGRSYDDLRNEDGEILSQVPTYEKASGQFYHLAQSSDMVASQAKENGHQEDYQKARSMSASHYRDAGRLTSDPRLAGSYQVASAAAYMDVGDTKSAGEQLNFANVSLRRAGKQADNDAERGVIATNMAEVRNLEYQREVAVNGNMSEGEHFARQDQVVAEVNKAQDHFANYQAQVLPKATASNSVEDWNDYGEAALARMRAAQIAEGVSGQKFSDELLLNQTQDLRSSAENGNPKALAVLGMVYAGAGRAQEAQAIFKQGNMQVSGEEISKMEENVRVGRYSGMRHLLNNIS